MDQRNPPDLFHHARDDDFWWIERDPEEHSRKSSAGALMDFELSEEQRLLQDNVTRLAQAISRTPQASRRTTATSSRTNWTQLAELGLLGLPFAESDGGLGGTPTETMI